AWARFAPDRSASLRSRPARFAREKSRPASTAPLSSVSSWSPSGSDGRRASSSRVTTTAPSVELDRTALGLDRAVALHVDLLALDDDVAVVAHRDAGGAALEEDLLRRLHEHLLVPRLHDQILVLRLDLHLLLAGDQDVLRGSLQVEVLGRGLDVDVPLGLDVDVLVLRLDVDVLDPGRELHAPERRRLDVLHGPEHDRRDLRQE